MTEFCPHLWNTITIDHKGDVYNCCLIQPKKLGSIYADKLSELVNIPEIVAIRQSSLNGNLHCYQDCNFIEKSDINPQKIGKVSPFCNYSDFKTLYVDFGLKCNISCVMCRQRERYKTDKMTLNSDFLIRNIDTKPFSDIFLQGGEPLYIDECLRYMAFLAKNNKKYSLFTNGVLIDKEMASRLAEEAKMIGISLNAATKKTHENVNRGSVWERVLDNIQHLRKCREIYNSDLSINGRMTLTVDALSEIPLFIKSYKDFGFDTINFGYDRDTVPLHLKQNPQFTSELSKEIKNVISSVDPSSIDTLRLYQLGLL